MRERASTWCELRPSLYTKVIPSKSLTIADIKEGQRVQVKYRNVNGKLRATQVRLM